MRTKIIVIGLAFLAGVVANLYSQELIPRQELGISTLETLNEAVLHKSQEHEKLLKEKGKQHPDAKKAEGELLMLETMRDKHLKRLPTWARHNIIEMDDDQLRHMVGILVQRLAELEDDVHELQNPQVRTELLNGVR